MLQTELSKTELMQFSPYCDASGRLFDMAAVLCLSARAEVQVSKRDGLGWVDIHGADPSELQALSL